MTGMKRIQATEYLVEATNFEQFILRQQNSDGIEWTEDLIPGEARTVGYIQVGPGPDGKCPIVVTLTWAILNEHRICFWDATSRMVDHHRIDTYFNRYLPGVRRVSAGNFHVAFHALGLPTPDLRDDRVETPRAVPR